jgi:soluble P-type ATPase
VSGPALALLGGCPALATLPVAQKWCTTAGALGITIERERRIDLLSMLKFAAHRYLAIGDTLNSISTSLGFPDFDHADILETKKNALASILRDLPRLREECSALGLRASVAQIERIIKSTGGSFEEISKLLDDLTTFRLKILKVSAERG